MGTAALALPASSAPPQSADGPAIPTYDVAFTLRRDGTLHVREIVAYDFGDRGGSGITRTLPYRLGDRLLRISAVRATSSTGAPARASISEFLHDLRIEVGGGGPVGGLQAYVLDYDVVGAIERRADHDELSWDAVGQGWQVPIAQTEVRVTLPVRPVWVSCAAGRPGLTTPCAAQRRSHGRVTEFTQSDLGPHEGMAIRVALPRGAVQVPPAVYAKRHLLFTWLGGVALSAAMVLAAAAWMRRAAFAGSGNASIVGTVLAVAGVAAVAWDVADDVVRGGVWSASIGDPALLGLAGAVLGGSLALVARARG